VLRAIAVMHIEIHHRDAPQPVHHPRLLGADCDIVEDTEAHGDVALGMMSGRPHGTKRILELARQHRIDRGRHGAGGAQRRLAGTG